jgi:predicted transcriptional regulator
LPLYKLLKKADCFAWTPETQEALDKLKKLLTSPPILVALRSNEALLLYIVAMTHVVSAALVVECQEEGHALKVQRPVYFISEVL